MRGDSFQLLQYTEARQVTTTIISSANRNTLLELERKAAQDISHPPQVLFFISAYSHTLIKPSTLWGWSWYRLGVEFLFHITYWKFFQQLVGNKKVQSWINRKIESLENKTNIQQWLKHSAGMICYSHCGLYKQSWIVTFIWSGWYGANAWR